MSNPVAQPQWQQTEVAAHLLGIIPELYDIRSRDDVRRAFEVSNRQKYQRGVRRK